MRSKNLAFGTTRGKGYTINQIQEEGVFKTKQGKFIVKVIDGKRYKTLSQRDNQKDALTDFNTFKGKVS